MVNSKETVKIKNGAWGNVLDAEVKWESIRTVARIGRWMAHGARGCLNEEIGKEKNSTHLRCDFY